MPVAITRKQREELLKQQHECCALCKKRLSILDRVCHDSVTGKLIDRKCMMLMSCLRAVIKDGVTLQQIIDYGTGEDK